MKMTAINDDPILFSLLYDLDLLPEQVKEGTHDWVRMQIIIEHWNMKSSKSEDVTKCAVEHSDKSDEERK